MGSDDIQTIDALRAIPVDGSVARKIKPRRRAPSSCETQAILVLGMHRSGTSVVARVLNLMGAYIGEPDELLPVHAQDNPTGYWERAELSAVHDCFLDATGHAWDRVAGFAAHDPEVDAAENLSVRLRRIIDKLNTVGKPWLVKDPRLCLLLSQWQLQLHAPAYVVVVRDPREIAASMQTGPRGTFTSHYVIALWEKYLRTLLADLRGRSALFVSYADMLIDPQSQSARLLRGLSEMGVNGLHAVAKEELHAFLDVKLRRSEPLPHMLLSPAQQSLRAWLDSQCQAAGPAKVSDFPEAPAPDVDLAEFQTVVDYHAEHGRQRALGETNERLGKIESRLDEQLHAHVRERERWSDELAAQRRQTEQTHAELVAQCRQTELAHSELADQRRQIAQTHIDLSTQRREAEQAFAEIAALNNDRDVLKSNLADAARERDRLREQAAALASEGQQLREHAAQLGGHIARLEQSVHVLRTSWSWKIMAPLRGIAGLFQWRVSADLEQRFYRIYYALPGMTPTRKRGVILWLHRHASWLTRHTMSYRFYDQARCLEQHRAKTREERQRLQRMDEPRALAVLTAIDNPPLISIVMPVYNVESRWLTEAVNSVRRQFYPHWELCIADDKSTRAETLNALAALAAEGDVRIKIRHLPKNLGIAGASNSALDMATGKYVGLLDNDDALTRDALLEMAQRIVAEQPDLLYSDEDKLNENGAHVEPYFKSDYSPDYLLCNNYLCHFSVIRRELFLAIGGFHSGFDGAQDFDLMLRVCERAKKIAHVPKVLYHWRKIPGSTAADSGGKPYTHEAGRRAVAAALTRRGIEGVAESGPFPNTYRVRRTILGEPLVSILIPFRDKPKLLSTCIVSILERTDYPHFEIIGIDNGSSDSATHVLMRDLERRDSRIRFIRYDAAFNYSAINNFGASHAQGEHLLLLNNDTEVIGAEWLRAMLEHSQRPEVGAVGAKLLYPDNTIQHAGVILGFGGVAGHSHLLSPAGHHGYFSRPQLIQNLSAVTFACAMTRRDVFEKMGGLNKHDLAIAFNDIDYCLRAREAGYLVVYTPYAQLYHSESQTRGYENDPDKLRRLTQETNFMRSRHAAALEHGDPYYNPYLSLTNNFQPDSRYADELPL